LGIKPLSAGFRTILIRPDLAGLEFASGTQPTPNGAVSVDIHAVGSSIPHRCFRLAPYADSEPRRTGARGIRLGERASAKERAYLLPEQLSPPLNSLPEPCRTLVVITVLTGLRIGELLALRWKHLDFVHDVIHVRETVHEGRFGSPKTKSSRRDVPMSQPVREALMAQRSEQTGADAERVVFVSRNGTPLNPKNLLRRVLQPTCRKLGLPVTGTKILSPFFPSRCSLNK